MPVPQSMCAQIGLQMSVLSYRKSSNKLMQLYCGTCDQYTIWARQGDNYPVMGEMVCGLCQKTEVK